MIILPLSGSVAGDSIGVLRPLVSDLCMYCHQDTLYWICRTAYGSHESIISYLMPVSTHGYDSLEIWNRHALRGHPEIEASPNNGTREILEHRITAINLPRSCYRRVSMYTHECDFACADLTFCDIFNP